ncbi:unnamed protein product [Boreogadus saida]
MSTTLAKTTSRTRENYSQALDKFGGNFMSRDNVDLGTAFITFQASSRSCQCSSKPERPGVSPTHRAKRRRARKHNERHTLYNPALERSIYSLPTSPSPPAPYDCPPPLSRAAAESQSYYVVFSYGFSVARGDPGRV